MKILHLYKDYFPIVGGIENHVKALAEAQVARGHNVTVLVNSLDSQTHVGTISGVRIIFAARLATVSSAPISLDFVRFVAHENPDIAHLHFPYPWGEAANYFFGRARRTVVTYHSDIIRQKFLRVLYRPLMWRVLARADRIVATSPNYIATSSVLRKFSDKCVVVPLGIDPAPFERAGQSYRFDLSLVTERALGVSKGHPSLLFVGLLRYYKGVDYLLRALTELPTARLVIVGTGPMERQWRTLSRELGVDERVLFAGQVSDEELPAYYGACDVFVLSASERSEAFGLVQLEAMAAGKPAVCTEIGTGTSFVNVDGETGFVVPARDPHLLATAIARLTDDVALRARMGAAGRARVRREFTLEKMVERVMRIYDDLIFGST